MNRQRYTGSQVIPFPPLRVPIIDSLRAARGRPMMSAFVEIDVTSALEAIRAYQTLSGERLSFTSFVAFCVARAVKEYPIMQAARSGRRLLLFDDVDVCALIEHDTGDGKQATPYVIRQANRKSLRAIHAEMRAAQRAGIGSAWEARGRQLYAHLPRLARAAFWWGFNHWPRMKQRIGGTVMVTAVGMFGTSAGWGLSSVQQYPLQVIVGSLVERLALVEGQIAVRRCLCLTLSADHEIVDGAPFARFIQRLGALLTAGAGLPETTALAQDASPMSPLPSYQKSPV